jgi:hypothetical protein
MGLDADTAIRPFHVNIDEEAVADLWRRIGAWRPLEREPVDDQSQGVQLDIHFIHVRSPMRTRCR